MDSSTGSKYEENKANLVEKIRGSGIEISFEKPGNNICYFCGNKIKDIMVKLTEKEEYNCKTFYFLDVNCYGGVKPFEYNQM